MIRVLLALLLLFPSALFAQDGLMFGVFPSEDGRVVYSRVFELPGLKKDQIYARVKEWAVNSFKSQKATLEAEDKEAGFIAYKSYFEAVDYWKQGLLKGQTLNYKTYNTLRFYIKDEKLKIVMSDIEVVTQTAQALADYKGTIPDRTKIETYEEYLDRRIEKKYISAKSAEKQKAYNRETFTLLDKQIKDLIEGIGSALASKKSEFEF